VLRLAWLDKLELFALSGSSSLPDLPPTEEEVLLQTVASASGSLFCLLTRAQQCWRSDIWAKLLTFGYPLCDTDSSFMEPSPLLGFEVVKDPGLLNFFVAITSTVRASNHPPPTSSSDRLTHCVALLPVEVPLH
jgi:hypothetical protein